jgi:hypothetical protein
MWFVYVALHVYPMHIYAVAYFFFKNNVEGNFDDAIVVLAPYGSAFLTINTYYKHNAKS